MVRWICWGHISLSLTVKYQNSLPDETSKVSTSLFNMIITDGLSGRENSWHLLGQAEKGAGQQVNVE